MKRDSPAFGEILDLVERPCPPVLEPQPTRRMRSEQREFPRSARFLAPSPAEVHGGAKLAVRLLVPSREEIA